MDTGDTFTGGLTVRVFIGYLGRFIDKLSIKY